MKYIAWFLFLFCSYIFGQIVYLIFHLRFHHSTPQEFWINAWCEWRWDGNIRPSPRDSFFEKVFGARDWDWDLEDRWKYQGTEPSAFERWLTKSSTTTL